MRVSCGCGPKAAAGSVIPGVIALLLPKCPLCLAALLCHVASIAAGTGVAVPAALAGAIRPGLGIACALLLGGLGLIRRSGMRRAIRLRRA